MNSGPAVCMSGAWFSGAVMVLFVRPTCSRMTRPHVVPVMFVAVASGLAKLPWVIRAAAIAVHVAGYLRSNMNYPHYLMP